MMQRKTQYALRNGIRHSKVPYRRAFQRAVAVKRTYKRIEISSSQDSVFLKLRIKSVSGHSIFFNIYKYGEIGVVMPHTGYIFME